MSYVLIVTDLSEQHVELLPARTVLSLFALGAGPGGTGGNSGGGGGDGLGTAIAKTLGFSTGGQSTPGPDGADGHSNQND